MTYGHHKENNDIEDTNYITAEDYPSLAAIWDNDDEDALLAYAARYGILDIEYLRQRLTPEIFRNPMT